ncbi:MAG: ACT domain-containing protein, partial [Actinomycetota bacterium]
MATALTVRIEDRPGELARVGEALGDAGVNVDGFCGTTAGGQGEIHLLVEDAASARSALE